MTRQPPRNLKRRSIAAALVIAGASAGSGSVTAQDILIIEDDEAPTAEGVPERYREGAGDRKQGPRGLSLESGSLWLEYGRFTDDAAPSDSLAHLRGELAALWSPDARWEVRLAARTYGYLELDRNTVDDLSLDYGESYIRYKGDSFRMTAGTQEIVWGRIDEFPPADRLSTQDISRHVVDELEYRRRPSPALRLEYFWNDNKLDLIAIPRFREAELPDRDSVWFPLNQNSGEVIGLESSPLTRQLVRNANVDLDAPDSAGGYGIRYSSTGAGVDYSLNVQKGRLSLPYFVFDPTTSTIGTRYPDTWSAGLGMAFEAFGGVMRMEGQWSADTPVTGMDGRFTTVQSAAWAVSLELFPGDGDARLNLQVLGNWLDTDFDVLDRDDFLAIGGSYELPMANDQWRLTTGFYAGLDATDWYLNPEITYLGIPGQELYLELHYFDGENGTPGGFHENHSFLALGWRLSF